jgi:hypothetical protein
MYIYIEHGEVWGWFTTHFTATEIFQAACRRFCSRRCWHIHATWDITTWAPCPQQVSQSTKFGRNCEKWFDQISTYGEMVRHVHLLDFHLRNGETIKNTQELSQKKDQKSKGLNFGSWSQRQSRLSFSLGIPDDATPTPGDKILMICSSWRSLLGWRILVNVGYMSANVG